MVKKLAKWIFSQKIGLHQALEEKEKFEWKNVNRILLIHIAPLGFGDLIMQSPGVQLLKEKCKNIDLLTSFPDVAADGLYENVHKWPIQRDEQNQLYEKLKGQYDLIILPTKLLWQPFMVYKLKPKYYIGYTNKWSYHANFNTPKSNFVYESDMHYIVLIEEILKTLGIDTSRLPKIPIPEISTTKTDKVKAMLDRVKHPLVIVTPNVNWKTRTYPVDKMITVLKRLKAEKPISIILIGLGDADLAAAKKIQQEISDAIVAVNEFKIKESAHILKEGDVHICGDCGTMHIGFGVRTPTVAMFGPIDPKTRFPLADKTSAPLWRGDLCDYKPMYDMENEPTWEDCPIIEEITEDDVVKASLKILREK